MKDKKITVLVDNDSWILPYAVRLVQALRELQYQAVLARRAEDIQTGWINFIIGCTRIINKEKLSLNQHNLVVHESDLPRGRGFAPMAWQILEGKKKIDICLLEADEVVDSGDIWLKDTINLHGHELCQEWRHLQGEKTIQICLRFIKEYRDLNKCKQIGNSTYYSRRVPDDSRLDTAKTLAEQFNLLRIVDNERYPAFFQYEGVKYKVLIFKQH